MVFGLFYGLKIYFVIFNCKRKRLLMKIKRRLVRDIKLRVLNFVFAKAGLYGNRGDDLWREPEWYNTYSI